MSQAKGEFTVQMKPEPPYDETNGVILGQIHIDKQFSGDLQATSHVEMLSARTSVSGSAGYVAIEKVTGTLANRTGSFVLQHSGTMNRGQASLALSVVPDSATDALIGLSGSMTIEIKDGKHFYVFDYQFEA